MTCRTALSGPAARVTPEPTTSLLQACLQKTTLSWTLRSCTVGKCA